ncbi:MAG: hypothetical protein WCP21_18225, partial [Armatimonadota bacterium]
NLAGTVLYEFTTDAAGNYSKTVAGPAQYYPKRKIDGVVCSPSPMTVSASGGIINIDAKVAGESKVSNPENHKHPSRAMKHWAIENTVKVGWNPLDKYNKKDHSWVFELSLTGEEYADLQSGTAYALCIGDIAVFDEKGGDAPSPLDEPAPAAKKKPAKKAAPKKK